MIALSADYGSEEADRVVGPLHSRLDAIFMKGLKKRYSQEIKEFVIVLKVSGRVCNYRLDGPVQPFASVKHRQLGINVGVPLKAWEHKTKREIKLCLADNLRAAVANLTQRLLKKDEAADLEALQADFEKCLKQFLK
jgi:hypothetical protein